MIHPQKCNQTWLTDIVKHQGFSKSITVYCHYAVVTKDE